MYTFFTYMHFFNINIKIMDNKKERAWHILFYYLVSKSISTINCESIFPTLFCLIKCQIRFFIESVKIGAV